jgi:hypothetical protein
LPAHAAQLSIAVDARHGHIAITNSLDLVSAESLAQRIEGAHEFVEIGDNLIGG